MQLKSRLTLNSFWLPAAPICFKAFFNAAPEHPRESLSDATRRQCQIEKKKVVKELVTQITYDSITEIHCALVRTYLTKEC